MTYWPVAFFILMAAFWLIAQMLKNNPDRFIKIAGGGYGVGAVIALLASGATDGFSFLIMAAAGTVATLIGLVFSFFWENA